LVGLIATQDGLPAYPVAKFFPAKKRSKSIKMYRKLFILFAVAAIISSCSFGGNSQPSISLDDIQATAQASALTAVAQTQMAMPTPTVPPTNTPEPTPEPVILEETATVAVAETVTVAENEPTPAPVVVIQPESQPVIVVENTLSEQQSSAPSGNNCTSLTSITKGRKVFVSIENATYAPATFSATLYENPLGFCGSTSVTLEGNSEKVIQVPEGCYFLYVWINDPKKPTTNSLEICVKQDKSNPNKIVQKWRIEKKSIKVINY